MSPAENAICDSIFMLLAFHPAVKAELVERLSAMYGPAGGVELLTAKEFAVRKKLHPDTVARWAREERIPAVDKVGREWRIPENAEVLPVNNVQSKRPSANPTAPRKQSNSDIEAVDAMIEQARKTRAAQTKSTKGGKT
jgi:excisionase family DNA binding protein